MRMTVFLACMLEHHVWAVPMEDRQGVFPRSEVMDVWAAMCVLGTKASHLVLMVTETPIGIHLIILFFICNFINLNYFLFILVRLAKNYCLIFPF